MDSLVNSTVWLQYSSLPLVVAVLVCLLVGLAVYAVGIGFNRPSTEPVYIDLLSEAELKRKKKKEKAARPAKPQRKASTTAAKSSTAAKTTAATKRVVPEQQRESKQQASNVQQRAASVSTATTEQKQQQKQQQQQQPWDQVVSRKQRRQQLQQLQQTSAAMTEDPARVEAATIMGEDRGDDSADSGIANASPAKIKRKNKKNKAQNELLEQVVRQKTGPVSSSLVTTSVVVTPVVKPKPAATKPTDKFTVVTKKKKTSKFAEVGGGAATGGAATSGRAGPASTELVQLTQEDFFNSGNGSRVLSLEEAMAALQRPAPVAEPAAATKPVVAHNKQKTAGAGDATTTPTLAASSTSSTPAQQPQAGVTKAVPIEEMMARLRAGEDITKPSPVAPPPGSVGQQEPSKSNVVFDELGDALTGQQSAQSKKKKKKTRKD